MRDAPARTGAPPAGAAGSPRRDRREPPAPPPAWEGPWFERGTPPGLYLPLLGRGGGEPTVPKPTPRAGRVRGGDPPLTDVFADESRFGRMRSVLSVPSRYCALWVLEGTASWGEGCAQRASSTARSPGALGPGIAPRHAGRDSHPLQRGGPKEAPPPHAVAWPPLKARRPRGPGLRPDRGTGGDGRPIPPSPPVARGLGRTEPPPGAVPRRSHGALAPGLGRPGAAPPGRVGGRAAGPTRAGCGPKALERLRTWAVACSNAPTDPDPWRDRTRSPLRPGPLTGPAGRGRSRPGLAPWAGRAGPPKTGDFLAYGGRWVLPSWLSEAVLRRGP